MAELGTSLQMPLISTFQAPLQSPPMRPFKSMAVTAASSVISMVALYRREFEGFMDGEP